MAAATGAKKISSTLSSAKESDFACDESRRSHGPPPLSPATRRGELRSPPPDQDDPRHPRTGSHDAGRQPPDHHRGNRAVCRLAPTAGTTPASPPL